MKPKKTKVSTRENRIRRNNLLYGGLNYNGNFQHQTVIKLNWFDVETTHTELINEPSACRLHPGKVNWVQVCGLINQEDVATLCKSFGISLPVIQDILNVRHIAKVEETGKNLFAVLDAYTDTPEGLVREHQSLILGKDLVISFEEGNGHRFDPVRKAVDEGIGQVRQHGADFLFNLLISMVVDSYFDVLENQQNALMEMEDALMEFQAPQQETGRKIQFFRKDFTRLKKAVSPLRESFGRMLMLESGLIQTETRLYFRDTYDHLQQVMAMLEANRETIASLMDLYLANNDVRSNNVMKQLTVVATIFIPLTFLAGVWGMNFAGMPELTLKYGYLFAWLVMIALGILLYLWFRRKNLL
jgi:magnesium transporter